MRIALLSDIHGNLAALEAVAQDLQRRSVDAVINLGDSLSGPLLPLETAQFLMAQDWLHLAGNHERQLLTATADESEPSDTYARSMLTQQELGWIAALRPRCDYNSEILLCHGTPRHDKEYLLETVEHGRTRLATPSEIGERLGVVSATLIACGHTHVPRSVRTERGQLIVNPGSVGLPAYDDDNPCFHVVENGSPDARYGIVERRGGGWIAELIAVPYPHAAMAQLARQRQRADWAVALMTGYRNPAP
ncbi:MAG: metallophosphoesterase family protein [Betaproteobacteria bacterium]|nr:metallophosphoesterase family protein [Betaproteobacteria bacterium]